MVWGKRPVTLPTQLEEQLKKVREVAPPPPPREDPVYKYLSRVYQLWHKLESSPSWKEAVQKYHAAHRLRIEKRYIRFIIEQTAGDHVTDRTKHKYKIILDLAFEEGNQTDGRDSFHQKTRRHQQVR